MYSITNLLTFERDFVLASASPRRKSLLNMIALDFKVVPSDFDEELISNDLDANLYVKTLSTEKVNSVAISQNMIGSNVIIIGADTTVVVGSQKLNKPKDEYQAKEMLNQLSGKWHSVFTGYTIFDCFSENIISNHQETKVHFKKLSSNEIDFYIATKSPMDKAGAYGIQDDLGALFIDRIEGCYYNVVGLPISAFYSSLLEMNNLIGK